MRTFLFQSYLWGYILSNSHRSFTINKLNKEGRTKKKLKLMDKIILKCTNKLIDIAGANLEITGTENIPLNEPVLYVSNHQGNMDIPILYSTAPQTMAFVAKKEMEKIPLLGFWMKERGCVFIDRDNARNSLKAINQASKSLKAGNSIAIFPEGTRSKGPKIGDFKSGSLRIAIKSGVKVIPVTIKDSYKLINKRGRNKPAKVAIHYSNPIDSRDFKDTSELAKTVLAQIKSRL